MTRSIDKRKSKLTITPCCLQLLTWQVSGLSRASKKQDILLNGPTSNRTELSSTQGQSQAPTSNGNTSQTLIEASINSAPPGEIEVSVVPQPLNDTKENDVTSTIDVNRAPVASSSTPLLPGAETIALCQEPSSDVSLPVQSTLVVPSTSIPLSLIGSTPILNNLSPAQPTSEPCLPNQLPSESDQPPSGVTLPDQPPLNSTLPEVTLPDQSVGADVSLQPYDKQTITPMDFTLTLPATGILPAVELSETETARLIEEVFDMEMS